MPERYTGYQYQAKYNLRRIPERIGYAVRSWL